jgi:hypothetical protein
MPTGKDMEKLFEVFSSSTNEYLRHPTIFGNPRVPKLPLPGVKDRRNSVPANKKPVLFRKPEKLFLDEPKKEVIEKKKLAYTLDVMQV